MAGTTAINFLFYWPSNLSIIFLINSSTIFVLWRHKESCLYFSYYRNQFPSLQTFHLRTPQFFALPTYLPTLSCTHLLNVIRFSHCPLITQHNFTLVSLKWHALMKEGCGVDYGALYLKVCSLCHKPTSCGFAYPQFNLLKSANAKPHWLRHVHPAFPNVEITDHHSGCQKITIENMGSGGGTMEGTYLNSTIPLLGGNDSAEISLNPETKKYSGSEGMSHPRQWVYKTSAQTSPCERGISTPPLFSRNGPGRVVRRPGEIAHRTVHFFPITLLCPLDAQRAHARRSEQLLSFFFPN